MVFKENERLVHRHFQHVGDILALIRNLQRLAAVAFAAADLAGHVNIGQEVHLDLQDTVARAGFAAAALDVKAEAILFIAARLRFRRHREHLANQIEQTRIRRRIGTRRTADGRLVDGDNLIQLLLALDRVVRAGARVSAVQIARKRFIDDLVDKRRFAAAGNARHARQHTERKFHVHMLEVVGARAAHGQKPRGRAARLRHGNKPPAAEILAGNRFRTGDNIVHRAAGHEMAAVRARSGADIDQKIRRAHRVLVVLDDDQRIAQIAQVFQRPQKPVVVALMQADGRLVENIQHAHQRRTDLRRQPDALRLAARKRRRGAGERQVSQSHVAQEVKPRPDLLENLLRDHFLPGRQLQLIKEIAQLHHRQIAQIGNRQPADRYRQHLGAQPLAVALRAGRVHHLRLVDLAHRVGVRLRILALQVRNDAFKRRFKFHHAGAGRIFDRDLFAVGAVKDHIQRLFRQFAHGRIDREAVMFCKRLEIDGAAARIAMRIPAAGHNRALRERKRLVRNYRVRVDRAQKAQSRARRARAERAVEREHARRHLFDADAAVRAGVIG